MMVSLKMSKEPVRVDGKPFFKFTLENPEDIEKALGEPIRKDDDGFLMTPKEHKRICQIAVDLDLSLGETIAHLAYEGIKADKEEPKCLI